MKYITNDLFDVTEFVYHCPDEFFIAEIKSVIFFIILVRINVQLTLIIFLCIPAMIAVCFHIDCRHSPYYRFAEQFQRGMTGIEHFRICVHLREI